MTQTTGFHGTDSFSYYATDGALDSDPVTVTITVEQLISGPQAVPRPRDRCGQQLADGQSRQVLHVDGRDRHAGLRERLGSGGRADPERVGQQFPDASRCGRSHISQRHRCLLRGGGRGRLQRG